VTGRQPCPPLFTLRSSNVPEHRDDTGVVSDASTLRPPRR
jgi:hypothetical protein